MRFNNDDYLKAFPREERAAAAVPEKTVVKDEPGSVFDDEQPGTDDTGAADPEAAEAEGGEDLGDE